MTPQIAGLLTELTIATDRSQLRFPDVLARLSAAGVERYHADLLRGEKIYYFTTGESLRIACDAIDIPVPEAFSSEGVASAVRAVQTAGADYSYPLFCEAIGAAGCPAYIVSLSGQRAMYYGRTAESYVEAFPPSP